MTQRPVQKQFAPGKLTVYSGPSELGAVTRALRATGRKIALVPTMGALHAGHRELISRARRVPGSTVVVSIFVNPLQFGPNEDFGRYPRAFDSDVDSCEKAGAELVFAPGVDDMYPHGANGITIAPGPLAEELEGERRPGHFAGMLTVVNKLFNIVRPDYAYFGEKDYQQLVLVRKMAAELNMDTHVVGTPTVREADGLAMSSRNVYLSNEQRESAITLSAALTAGVMAGPKGADAVIESARAVLAARPEIVPDYLELRDLELGPAPKTGQARLLIAAKFGATRLIDNALITLG